VDVTERKRAEQELRDLASRLQAVREEERGRLAREIHDVLAQELTRIKLDISWLKRRLSSPVDEIKQQQLLEKLVGMSQLADAAIGSVQKIATELRPVVLDTLGLCAAIEWQARDFEARTNIPCYVSVPEEDVPLGREHSTAIFRILQESLTNVVRHAGASRVELQFNCMPGQASLVVRDNGKGIAATEITNPHSLGLVGMRERATLLGGVCSITGQPGNGTAVEVRFDLPSKELQKEEAG
jgi:signal transduction histidine kinase